RPAWQAGVESGGGGAQLEQPSVTTAWSFTCTVAKPPRPCAFARKKVVPPREGSGVNVEPANGPIVASSRVQVARAVTSVPSRVRALHTSCGAGEPGVTSSVTSGGSRTRSPPEGGGPASGLPALLWAPFPEHAAAPTAPTPTRIDNA